MSVVFPILLLTSVVPIYYFELARATGIPLKGM